MFKGKGRWLTTLLVAVGAAVAVQGQATAHAATNGTVDADPVTVKLADEGVVAAKSAPNVKLTAVPEAAATDTKDWQSAQAGQTKEAATTTPDAKMNDTVKDLETTTQGAVKPVSTAAASETAIQTAAKPVATVTAELPAKPVTSAIQDQTAQDDQLARTDSNATVDGTSATQKTETEDKSSDATTSTEQDGTEPAKVATGDKKTAVTGTVTTEKPQFKFAVDAATATQADTLAFTPVTDPSTISLSRTIQNNGKSYTFTAKAATYAGHTGSMEWGYPLFNNSVTDDANSSVHTYSYELGWTGGYYKRDLNASATDYEPLAYGINLPYNATVKYEVATAPDNTPYLRMTTDDTGDQLTITETLSINSSGAFDHVVSIRNDSSSALSNVKFGTLLDTMLDKNDNIPIVSNGDGSVNISNEAANAADELVLYLTPTENDTLTVGQWKGMQEFFVKDNTSEVDPNSPYTYRGDLSQTASAKPAAGNANGTTLVSGVDTGAQYETPALTLAPGASTTYSYSEHLYTEPVTTGTIGVKYQDEGGTTIKPDTTTGGVVGSPFVLSSQAKTIDGYTYLRTDGDVTTFTKDPQTLTLIFKKNQPAVTTQTATITYEDVTDNKVLGAVDTTTGDSGTTATYTSSTRINEYKSQGYKLVSDGTAKGIIFDNDESKDQPFVVKLAHNVVPVTPDDPHDADPKKLTATATRVINYVNTSDPTKVPSPATKTQSVTLTQTVTEDLVTKDVTYGNVWTTGTVDAVTSPSVLGYTPDKETVPTASFSTPDVNGKPSATVTVTYTAADETQRFQYVDDDKGGAKVGDPVSESGKNGASSTYTATAPAGYVLAKNQSSTIAYKLKPNAPVIDIHLAHQIVDVTPKDPHDADPKTFSATATRVINYVNTSDPTKVPSPATQTQSATLTRTGKEDLVSKTVTYSAWTAGSVEAVTSPTVAGYTPDKTTVPTASFTTPDVNGKPSATVTVTYTAADETQQFQYVDDDNNQSKVGDPVSESGKNGASAIYTATTPAGYVLAKNQSSTIAYTLKPNAPVIDIHLAHDVVPVTPEDPHDADPKKFSATATRTINYVKTSDGSKVTEPVPQNVTFNRTGTEDLLTHKVTFPDWQAQTVEAVTSPTIPGYTPDQATVPSASLMPDDNLVVTVKYAADNQQATVIYVDGSNKQIIPSQTITGETDTAVDHSQIKPNIQAAMDKGYTVATDGTRGAKFGTSKDQTFVVTFVPIENASVTTNLVPHDPNGRPLKPTTPESYTGKPGDPISKTDYPVVPGYTPNDKQNKVVPNKPGDTIVNYTPDTQKATVTYVDQSGKQLITPDQTLTGASDTAIAHSQITPNIQKAIDQGYVLVNDGTVGAKFDHDDKQPQGFKVVFGQVPKAELTTTIVPKGPNGDPLTPTTPVQITGFPGDPISETEYPNVPGYTPNQNQHKVVPNEPGDTTVDYTPDTQTATVTYVDQSGKQLITPDQTLTGASDTAIAHSQVTSNIQKAIDQGYVLVNDGTVGAKFDHDDAKPQSFKVVFGQVPKAELTTTIVPKGPNGDPLTPTTPVQITGFPGDPISETEYPNVPGYTPNQNQHTVVPNEPGDTTVDYTPNIQTATIIYVDGSGAHLIPDQPVAGKSDTPVDHAQIETDIQTVINQGYNLVTDGTVGVKFDHDDGKTQIFTVLFSKIPAPQTPGEPGGSVPTPPAGDSNTDKPGLPSTFGETTPNQPENGGAQTPNEPGESTTGGGTSANEPGLPSTFGDSSTGDSTSKTELAAADQTPAQSQAQVNAAAPDKVLPQTGDKPATGLAWLGATLMMLLGLAERKRKLDR